MDPFGAKWYLMDPLEQSFESSVEDAGRSSTRKDALKTLG